MSSRHTGAFRSLAESASDGDRPARVRVFEVENLQSSSRGVEDSRKSRVPRKGRAIDTEKFVEIPSRASFVSRAISRNRDRRRDRPAVFVPASFLVRPSRTGVVPTDLANLRQRVHHQKLTRASSDAPAHALIRGNPSSFNREQYLPFSGVLGPTFPIARETFRAAGAPKGAGLRRMSITVTSDRVDKIARPLRNFLEKESIVSVISFIYNVNASTAGFDMSMILEILTYRYRERCKYIGWLNNFCQTNLYR